MAGLSRWVLSCLAIALLAVPAAACPFCSMQGKTLTGELTDASMVLYGDLTNAKEPKDSDIEGTTDLVVETAIKVLRDYEGKKTITLARYIPPSPDKKYRYLVFCDLFKGKVDPYKVLAIDANADLAGYLKGAIAHKDDPIAKRLRFFFDYLDSTDLEISNDAYKEFANADYKDYKEMARTLPADKIVSWLQDKNTPAFRFGLYASMLGHCGSAKHARLLHDLLEDPVRRAGSGVDGILAGYVLLAPQEGWQYVTDIFKDPKKEFLLRYAALRSVRFLYDSRPDLIARKELLAGASQLLEQGDIADLLIDDLRKWQRWEMADRVLGLKDKPCYEVSIVRRAILRYCLCCKGHAGAETYVAQQRKKDPQAVADVEELLKLEQPPALTGTAGK